MSRPEGRAVNRAELSVTVSRLTRPYHGEDVYFYTSPTAKGVGTLVGHGRLRPVGRTLAGFTTLLATLDFTDSAAFYIRACVIHAVVPNMGLPFTDRPCGRRTLGYDAG